MLGNRFTKAQLTDLTNVIILSGHPEQETFISAIWKAFDSNDLTGRAVFTMLNSCEETKQIRDFAVHLVRLNHVAKCIKRRRSLVKTKMQICFDDLKALKKFYVDKFAQVAEQKYISLYEYVDFITKLDKLIIKEKPQEGYFNAVETAAVVEILDEHTIEIENLLLSYCETNNHNKCEGYYE